LNREHDESVVSCFILRADHVELQLSTALDHLIEHLVDGVGMFTRPARHGHAQAAPRSTKERRGRGILGVFGRRGEETLQVGVVEAGMVESVVRAFLPIVFRERRANGGQRFHAPARHDLRFLLCELTHQLIDVFQLADRGPVAILGPPARPWLEPDRERFGKVLGGVALRIPRVQVQDEFAAVRLRPVVLRIG
jgi:hypothetical protein